MRIALITILMLSTAAVAQDRSTQFPATLVDPVIETASVKVERELMLPGQDSGALVELVVKKGDFVEQNATLGHIDNTEAVMTLAVAQSQLRTAEKNAGEGSKIQLEYAEKAAAVAHHKFVTNRQAHEKRGAVTDMAVRESELEYERAVAQIDVRKLEEELASIEVAAKQAEVEAAQQALDRRHLRAPFAGIVEDVYRNEGEWVQAGEPILRLMDFETMTVSGSVSGRLYSRQDIDGRPVTVLVEQPGNQRVELKGTIAVVSRISDGFSNVFTVEAHVPNRKIGNHWVLADGAKVTMTIHVN